MESENHGKKCEFCVLLEQLSGESTDKRISKNESFVVIDYMDEKEGRQGVVIISTLHKKDLNIKDQREKTRLIKSIEIASVKLKKAIKFVQCNKKANHYHLKVFPK